jgi:hypothetical protein
MDHQPSVTVERVEGYPHAVRLKWERYVVETDIRPAFHQLTRFLDEASQPINVLVDLRSDPHLPLQTTISETLSGPFLHKKMGLWLVVGFNQRAEVVANVISAVGPRDTIRWYKTEAEALEHLSQLEERYAPAWG